MKTKIIFLLAVVFSVSLLYFIFSSVSTVKVIDNPLNEPPETYAGQVIIKYTHNYKEDTIDGLLPDETVLLADVMGTLYASYAQDYKHDEFFSGDYLFEEGQISWNYNSKRYTMNPPCEYLIHSVGSGNIDIEHTDKINLDSKIWKESDGEYTLDINNYGRIYLTADGIPIEDTNLAQTPVQTTTTLMSGSQCSAANPTNEVPPEISIRLENLKAVENIISGEQVLYPGVGVKDMISYTIELPPVKPDDSGPEEPSISNDNPDKQGLLAIFFNWVKNLFGKK